MNGEADVFIIARFRADCNFLGSYSEHSLKITFFTFSGRKNGKPGRCASPAKKTTKNVSDTVKVTRSFPAEKEISF